MGQDQGGFLDFLDHVGHGVRFPRPGDPQQGLLVHAGTETVHQSVNRLRLVARGLVIGLKFEGNHKFFKRSMLKLK